MKVWFSNRLNWLLAQQLAFQWRGKPSLPLDLSDLCRVLMIELGGLGDAVNLLPALSSFRAAAPNARLSFVCRDYVSGFFESITDGGNVVGIRKSSDGVNQTVRRFGSVEWDIVISTCWSTWATVIAQRLRAKRLAGYWQPWHAQSYGFTPVSTPRISREEHLCLIRYKAIAPLGIDAPTVLPAPHYEPPTRACDSCRAKHPAFPDQFITFVPFCEDSQKSLTFDEAVAALDTLHTLGLPVILAGGMAEEQRLNQLAKNDHPVVLTNLSIPDLSAILNQSRMTVSVDTGAMHLAAAVGTPTIGLFKSTDPLRCGLFGSRTLNVAVKEWHSFSWRETAASWLQ